MRRLVSSFTLLLLMSVASSVFAQDEHAAPPPAGKADAGKETFQQKCSVCHSTEAGKTIVGPSLFGELKEPSPKKTPDEVRAIITGGKGVMPPFKAQLTSQDIENLIAYLKTQQ
jgi:mono/diheme cytochrome c family protein